MNSKTTESNWAELKTKIRARWGRINEDEVDAIRSDLRRLMEKLQEAYGISEERAKQQYEEFRASLKEH